MFALDAVVPLENEGMFVAEATVALVLRGDEPIAQRTADAAPRYRPFRRHESVRTARVVAIGDALETVASVARIALNKTCAGMRDRLAGSRPDPAASSGRQLGRASWRERG